MAEHFDLNFLNNGINFTTHRLEIITTYYIDQ